MVAPGTGFGISVATGWHYHLDLIGTGIFSAASLALVGQPGRELGVQGSLKKDSSWLSRESCFGFLGLKG